MRRLILGLAAISLLVAVSLWGCDTAFVDTIGFGPMVVILLTINALIAFWLMLRRWRKRAKYLHDQRWTDTDVGGGSDSDTGLDL